MSRHTCALTTWLTTLVLALLSIGVLLSTPSTAHAAIDCWMDAEHPTTGDSRAVSDPALAPLRQALHRLNAILHRHPALHALPRTRLRSSWQIGGQWTEPARAANFLLRDHRETMWVPGRCDVINGADRLEPKASIVVTVNAPASFFETAAAELRDEQLEAWREVPVTGQLNGMPFYGGHMLVFTRGARRPWVPVTTAEYTDFTLRDLRRSAQAESAARAGLPPASDRAAREAHDEAQVQKVMAGLRQIDPAMAEKTGAELRVQLRDAREHEAKQAARRAAAGADASPLQTMIRRVETWRASLSPAQLAQPARLGLNGLHDDATPIDRLPRLVRPDPHYPWDRQHPTRPQMLMVSIRGGDVFEAPMQRVMEELDVRALQALVE